MKLDELQQVLANNLSRLMEERHLSSGLAVESVTGVSRAQVNNIKACRHSATIETLSKLSEGFGVLPWALLHPAAELLDDPRLAALIDAFERTPESGRDVILQVAEAQARYSVP